ncbi:non-receptor tyrosine-protein kinase TNK1-like [Pollicipes pollicipes]|uniref:non-receptor tyrosine-protein kinase TNK1-like n=1 Tax=Pollicipes pollicipes TaxID=41117 RepID=UPI001884CAD0|nr:non-receptor tyrosine-protein kinase TNK1-like [Pollicipes pollicipes]
MAPATTQFEDDFSPLAARYGSLPMLTPTAASVRPFQLSRSRSQSNRQLGSPTRSVSTAAAAVRSPPAGGPHRKVDVPLAVREVLQQLPGIPVSEVRSALHTCAGNTQGAIKFLKVDRLYRLGLATKPQCEAMLCSFNWDVELAASRMLDTM